jgi:hypothetical protein
VHAAKKVNKVLKVSQDFPVLTLEMVMKVPLVNVVSHRLLVKFSPSIRKLHTNQHVPKELSHYGVVTLCFTLLEITTITHKILAVLAPVPENSPPCHQLSVVSTKFADMLTGMVNHTGSLPPNRSLPWLWKLVPLLHIFPDAKFAKLLPISWLYTVKLLKYQNVHKATTHCGWDTRFSLILQKVLTVVDKIFYHQVVASKTSEQHHLLSVLVLAELASSLLTVWVSGWEQFKRINNSVIHSCKRLKDVWMDERKSVGALFVWETSLLANNFSLNPEILKDYWKQNMTTGFTILDRWFFLLSVSCK